jgi:hypothetical protein
LLTVALGAASLSLGTGSSTLSAPDAATVAAAHAAFIKDMSAHPPVVAGSHGWVSPGADHRTALAKEEGNVTGLQTANWSGYADADSTTTGTFTNVSGRWTIPDVSCPRGSYRNQDAFVAQWVGIDGFSDHTVEQLGTATQCFEDVTYYYVWYEMYPGSTVEEGTAACINNNVDCPQPGDQVSASVSVTSAGAGENSYTLSLTDFTTPAESFSVTQQCPTATCADTSAEWIVERPAVATPFGTQVLPLADYSKTEFRHASVVSSGVASSSGGFAGSVYDLMMTDDTDSYYLSCTGQLAPPETLLLTAQSNACPIVPPRPGGGFTATWDSSF